MSNDGHGSRCGAEERASAKRLPDKIAARRLRWAARRWRVSETGNSFLNVRGFNVVVFGSRKGYGIKIEQRYGDRLQFGRQRFETRAEAQAAAFDALLWAEQAWHGNGRYDLPAEAASSVGG